VSAPSPERLPRPKTRAEKTARARDIFAQLRVLHPDAHCELDHNDAFELLVATVLSAQTTDKLVNKATPALFGAYPNAAKLASADAADVAELLRSSGLGMYNQKGKNIVGLARGLMERHGGEVPRSLDDLVKLPGVGRKTANVVLGVIWGTPEGVVVDTHVQRLSQRLGFTKEAEPGPIEEALCDLFPREDWDPLSHTLIFHGRRICFAQRPACSACGVNTLCPSAFRAENVGRKAPRVRALVERAVALAKPVLKRKAETKKAATKASVAKPATKKPATKKPATKKPATKKPGAKK
jgi:endonuclease-3